MTKLLSFVPLKWWLIGGAVVLCLGAGVGVSWHISNLNAKIKQTQTELSNTTARLELIRANRDALAKALDEQSAAVAAMKTAADKGTADAASAAHRALAAGAAAAAADEKDTSTGPARMNTFVRSLK